VAIRLENPRRWRRSDNQQTQSRGAGTGAKQGKAEVAADSKYSNKKVIEERVVDIGPPEKEKIVDQELELEETKAHSSLVEDKEDNLSEAEDDGESSWEDDSDKDEAVATKEPAGVEKKKQRVYCLPKEEQDVEPVATKGT